MTHLPRPNFRWLGAAALGAALLSGGCLSSLLPEPAPPPVVYRLSSPEPSSAKVAGATVVRVDNVSAPFSYNTRDVLVVTPDGALASAAEAQWSDDIPELIQDAMLSQLAKTDRFIGVIPVAGARSKLRLHIDVRNFSAVYDEGELAAPLANVHVYATVSVAASRDFVGSFDAVAQSRADDNRVSSIVRAQSEATREALSDVVRWMEGLESRS